MKAKENPNPAITKDFDVMAFLIGEEDLDIDEEACLDKSKKAARTIFHSFLDMYLSEITVPFVNSKGLNLKLCQDLIKPLSSVLSEIADSGIHLLGKSRKFNESVSSQIVLLQEIFPPCMWDDIEMAERKIIIGLIREKFAILAQSFKTLPKEQQKENIKETRPSVDDKLIIPVIQSLKNENGKPILSVEEIKLFIAFIYSKHNELYNECAQQRNAYCIAQNREKRVEDIEIEIRNGVLDLTIAENEHIFFKMSGLKIAEVNKVNAQIAVYTQ